MFALLLATSTSAKRLSHTCKVKIDWLILPCMRSVIGQIFATHPRAATYFSDRETTRLDKMDRLVCNVIYCESNKHFLPVTILFQQRYVFTYIIVVKLMIHYEEIIIVLFFF